jgi:hypothetical protein
MTSTSDVLGKFWAEAVEMVTTERRGHENEKAAQLAAAKDLVAETVPADVLAALGLDVSTAVMPAQYDGAVVDGSCVFEGERIETKVTASLRGYNRHGVNLEVGGKSVAIDEKVRARVGLALGQAVQARRDERKAQGERLLLHARQWSVNDSDLTSRNLRLDKMSHVPGEAVAEARRIVAGRKWAARKEAWERVRRLRAERVLREERAAELIAACGEWAALEDGYQAACRAWAADWTAWLEREYGRPELWRVTYTATSWEGRGARGEEEEMDWTAQTVVMEAPEDLREFSTLVPVTEVSATGTVTEGVRLGAIVRMEPVMFDVWPRMDAALPYCRSVKAGEFWVNVPAAAVTVKPGEDRPVRAHAMAGDWLTAMGFERQVDRLRWCEYGAGEIAAMDVEHVVEILFV